MNYFHEIARIVASMGKKKIEIIDVLPAEKDIRVRKSKEWRLYKCIAENKSEEESAQEIYGYDATEHNINYRSLKHNVIERLLNNLFFLKLGNKKNASIASQYYYCIISVAQLKILRILVGTGYAARVVAYNVLGVAKKCDNYEAMCEAYNALSVFHSMRGEINLFEKYSKEEERCANILIAEKKCKFYFNWCMANHAAFSSSRPELIHQLDEFIAEIKAIRVEYSSPNIIYNSYEIMRIRAETVQDYDAILQICEEAAAFAELHSKIFNITRRTIFYLSALAAYLNTGRYSEAYRHAEKLDKMYRIGSQNWFYFKEIHLILALRSENMSLACDLFTSVVNNPNFDRGSRLIVEKWTLLEFYVRFLASSNFSETLLGDIIGDEGILHSITDSGSYFRQFKKLFPLIGRDKTGFKLSVFVASVSYLLSIGDTDGVIISDEAIQLFRRRHIPQSDSTYRLACFIQLIHAMVKNDFDRKKTERNALKWLQKMSSVKGQLGNNAAEAIEVVPFERLWELFLNNMDTNAELLQQGLRERRERLAREALAAEN